MPQDKDRIIHIDELLGKAESLMSNGNFDGALDNLTEAFNEASNIEYMAGVARAIADIGYVYQMKKDFQKAFEYYEKAAETWDQIGHPPGVAGVLNNMFFIFRELNQIDKAIAYLEKALDIKRNYDSEASLAKSLNNMGNYLEELGKVEESIDYYMEAIELKLRTETTNEEFTNPDTRLSNIGLVLKVAQICDSLADSYKNKKQSILLLNIMQSQWKCIKLWKRINTLVDWLSVIISVPRYFLSRNIIINHWNFTKNILSI